MCFKKGTQHMLVLRERKTMMTLSSPLPSKRSWDTAVQIVHHLTQVAKEARKTLTVDNGAEFAKHHIYPLHLEDLKVYFCDPYASWQKGGIENTNGRLRRDLPRNTNLKEMKKEEFDEIIENYNNTPRKRLKWLTPLQAFQQNLKNVALQT
jgi:IS30 family transposase